MPIELYPHQKKAVELLGNGKILLGEVGSGKTMAAIGYYVEKEAPRDVYVITTAKKRDSKDWEDEFLHFGISGDRLVVDSWNNIGKYVDVEGAFFIFDEQRLVGSGSWSKAFIKIAKLNRWILLSATPGDTWMDYVPVFIANGFFKNRTEFKTEHVVYNTFTKFPKVDRYIGVQKLVRLRNQILVHMPYERHTMRRTEWLRVDFDRELLERVTKDRWHVYENRPLRDVAELFSVARKVANSDASRLSTLRGLFRTHPKLIVFYNFDYELETLRTLVGLELVQSERSETWNGTSISTNDQKDQTSIESEQLCRGCGRIGSGTSTIRSITTSSTSDDRFCLRCQKSISTSSPSCGEGQIPGSTIDTSQRSPSSDTSSAVSSLQIAEWNGHKHQLIPKGDAWAYLVQYTAGAEGWNCVETDAMVFWSLTYSFKQFHQAFGRIDRLNTPFSILNYYVFVSNSWIDLAIKKSLQEKRSFNESSVGIKF